VRKGGEKIMPKLGRIRRKTVLISFLVLLSLPLVAETLVASIIQETQEPEKLDLVVGKSIVLTSTDPLNRVSVAMPEIADVTVLSKRQIYITPKAAGLTNLILWQKDQVMAIYDLEVSYDLPRLKQKMHDVLPTEGDISVIATHHSVTLSGMVSSTENISKALAVARAFAPEGKINKLIQVGGVHQVMLDVRVAEVSRSVLKNLGVNFNYTRGDDFAFSLLDGLSGLATGAGAALGAGPAGLLVAPTANALFRFHKGSAEWTGIIDALKEDGLLKILAEPTLIALSGHEAYFLAGGEYPVPVPQGLGTVGIEYKSFGVGLSFKPNVLSENRINIAVTPEVSELDFTTATAIEGTIVPGLNTRRASTVVELADGQSFAIAGLLKEAARESIRRYPGLGDIPILGTLFRSKRFQNSETELVIVVTPHLVKPLDMAKQTLPTDYYVEPDDAEFYIWGVLGKSHEGLDGDFGHSFAE
jgi:pilus assembly protein CpaC